MAVDERVVQRWLDRGQKFFRAVTNNGKIKGTLAARGLTHQELKVGWRYYSRLLGFEEKASAPTEVIAQEAPQNSTAAEAMAELDAWDAPTYRAIAAVTEHRWPSVHLHLFDGVSADKGPRAVAGVERFLANYQGLIDNSAEDVSESDAAEAVQLLERRRLMSPGIADRLSTLVNTAQSGAAPIETQVRPEEEYEASFIRFRNWLNEWREVARNSITRRDYQIMLGLAARHSRSRDDEDDVVDDEDDNGPKD